MFRSLANFLKKRFGIKVSIRRTKVPKGHLGDCDFAKGSFVIRVCKDEPESSAIWTLLHEFPHTMSWDEWVETGKHGPKFAKAYEVVYRAYEEWVGIQQKAVDQQKGKA
jgi:hypothetical protein